MERNGFASIGTISDWRWVNEVRWHRGRRRQRIDLMHKIQSMCTVWKLLWRRNRSTQKSKNKIKIEQITVQHERKTGERINLAWMTSNGKGWMRKKDSRRNDEHISYYTLWLEMANFSDDANRSRKFFSSPRVALKRGKRKRKHIVWLLSIKN